jgi:hypothetical protein
VLGLLLSLALVGMVALLLRRHPTARQMAHQVSRIAPMN